MPPVMCTVPCLTSVGAVCPVFTGLPLMRRHRNCASGGILFLACQKKYAKRDAGYESDCTAVPQKEPIEEHCGQHTGISLQS